jgi:hypothetical protein
LWNERAQRFARVCWAGPYNTIELTPLNGVLFMGFLAENGFIRSGADAHLKVCLRLLGAVAIIGAGH